MILPHLTLSFRTQPREMKGISRKICKEAKQKNFFHLTEAKNTLKWLPAQERLSSLITILVHFIAQRRTATIIPVITGIQNFKFFISVPNSLTFCDSMRIALVISDIDIVSIVRR